MALFVLYCKSETYMILHTIASSKRLLKATSNANWLSHQTFVKIIEGLKKINPIPCTVAYNGHTDTKTHGVGAVHRKTHLFNKGR